MNLVDPEAIAAALKPVLDNFEKQVLSSVTSGVKQIDETIQSGIDRLHGIKINASAEIDVPPRAEPNK